MSILLTQSSALELVQMPKRLLRETDLAWQFTEPPKPSKPGKKIRNNNPRAIKARMIEVGGRETFLLVGNSNGSYGFRLLWNDFTLTRIDSQPLHYNNELPEDHPEYSMDGPHVHYYVPGKGVNMAYRTTEYDQTSVYSGLAFFLRLCNLQNPPPVQEVLSL